MQEETAILMYVVGIIAVGPDRKKLIKTRLLTCMWTGQGLTWTIFSEQKSTLPVTELLRTVLSNARQDGEQWRIATEHGVTVARIQPRG